MTGVPRHGGRRAAPAALLTLLALTGCMPVRPADPAQYSVRADCRGAPRCFQTLQAALDEAGRAAPSGWLTIDVAGGEWREKVVLTRPRTRLRGAGASRTFLRFGEVAETAAKFHRDRWGTAGSATLTIDADEVIVEDLTVENTFDYLANDALPDGDPHKLANSQALAVLLDKHSDRVLIRDAALLGYQDTLFANGARAVVRRSLIAGNVDFIFGNGQLLVEDATIRTRPRSARLAPGEIQSMVTAPSTPSRQPFGIVIHRSRLTREAGVPDGSVALGRPWHPTRSFPDGRYADPDAIGQVSFVDCWFDAHIHPEHWTSMLGTARDGTKTQVFRPQDARFHESGSRGPGARHVDIGLTWTAAPSIADVKRVLFENWQEGKE